MKIKFFFIISFLWLHALALKAQQQPIGYWNSLMTYNSASGVVTDGNIMYTITKNAFFTYNNKTGELVDYSKVNGMSDIGMQCIGYSKESGTVILVYSNGNIDIFKDGQFYNIPDLKYKTVAGAKTVFQIHTEQGMAYLSTSLGIIVIDMKKKVITATYQFFNNSQLVPMYGFASAGNYYYVIGSSGIYKTSKSTVDLQNYLSWTRLDSVHSITQLASVGADIYFATTQQVYILSSDTLKTVYTDTRLSHINGGLHDLFITNFKPYKSKVKVMNPSFQITDSIIMDDSIAQVLQLDDSSIWIANANTGLAKRMDNVLGYFYPSGPGTGDVFDIYAHNGDVLVAHGGFSDSYVWTENAGGFSKYHNGSWSLFKQGVYYPFYDSMRDFVSIVRDETNGYIYAGSFQDGVYELRPDLTGTIYKNGSALEGSINNGPNYFQVVGTGLDRNNNLWVSMFGSYSELYVKEKTTNNWYKYHVSYNRSFPYAAGPMVFDESNNIWYPCVGGGGVVGYSTNNTLANPNDDIMYFMNAGVGAGNLPNSTVYALAVDQNDNLWIGTNDGIGILYNASSSLKRKVDAEIPIVQYDKYAGYLFKGEAVRTIAVDGANRKWIGTDNGVWLLSPDAGNSKIIERFTAENSPLPSDKIKKIAIDKVTGVVYIGTDKGLVSYRSTATEGGTTNTTVTTYPNPVPSNYSGTIAIKGLVANADVRITDMSGQLIYRTTALGGQAIWNGLDYTGRKPQSGVYLIFSTNSDGTQALSGKMVFLN